MFAAKSQFVSIPDVIVAIMKAGANVNATDRQGMTPLMYAANVNPKTEVIAALLKGGADVKAANPKGMTPLMLAATGNRNIGVIKAVIEAGADIEAKDKDGRTALDHAREIGNSGAEEALLAAGAQDTKKGQK